MYQCLSSGWLKLAIISISKGENTCPKFANMMAWFWIFPKTINKRGTKIPGSLSIQHIAATNETSVFDLFYISTSTSPRRWGNDSSCPSRGQRRSSVLLLEDKRSTLGSQKLCGPMYWSVFKYKKKVWMQWINICKEHNLFFNKYLLFQEATFKVVR